MTARRAKILATLGPSSSEVPIIKDLILSGVDSFRVNMSHGDHEAHQLLIANIREASRQTGWEVAIVMDLQGPKIRVGKLDHELTLSKNEVWYLSNLPNKANYSNFIPTTYQYMIKDAQTGAKILFDDGAIEAKVTNVLTDAVELMILNSGILKSNKGINLPGVKISENSLTDKDERDLFFGLEHGIDYVALSFVRTSNDIKRVRKMMIDRGPVVPIISKIEKPEAIANIDDIIKESDMIMIARGDMGVELGNHLVPAMQKELINKCNMVGMPVITATQMLESMIDNPRPTRAEASDVANAIWDGTDVVMLSGETAAGKYPVKVIEMMDQIVKEAEKQPKVRPLLRHVDLSQSVTSTVVVAASLMAEKLRARWIIAVTEQGKSCLRITRFRPDTRVLGLTNSIKVQRKMCLYWGVSPYLIKTKEEGFINMLEKELLKQLRTDNLVTEGDKVIITHGSGNFFVNGTASSVRVEVI